jgi:hypothetical protein
MACDPYSEAHLCNESSADLEVTIKIDQDYVEKGWGHQQVRFLKSFGNDRELVEISIDTVSMTGIYKLERGQCSILYDGISSTPRFMFNYLKINLKEKSLVYNSREEIEKAFLPSEVGNYKLIVRN